MAWHGKVRPGLLLLLISFVVISEAMTKVKNTFPEVHGSYRYETAYACEGKILKIECKDGELIKLIRANYGRFSIAICNDHGHTDWSVNCMSPKSLRVLHGRCTQNQNCSIPASTSMFGDPCPGTHKYLEAHYQCLPATTTTTTNRPSPPWLITSQPPMWSTIKPTSRPAIIPIIPKSSKIPPLRTTTTSSTVTKTTVAVPKPLPPQLLPDDDIFSKIDIVNSLPEEITTISYTTYIPKRFSPDSTVPYIPSPSVPFWNDKSEYLDYCKPITMRTIFWNWTRISDLNVQPCPGGTTGYAKWRCIKTETGATWYPDTPDLSACKSVWLTSLEQRIQNANGKDPLLAITNDLAQVTSSKTLYGGDMMITTKIIKTLTRKMSQDIQTFADHTQRETFVTEMLNHVVKTSSNLLDASQHPSWTDLSYEEQMRVATSLLIGLEENAFLLADTVVAHKTFDQVVKNIRLSVRVLEIKQITSERYPAEYEWSSHDDTIILPQGALLDNSEGELVRLVFVSFTRLEEILHWRPDSLDNKNISRVLNSKVVCASLGKGRHIQLKEPVSLTLKHLQTENVTNPSCVFWDYSMNIWSNEGCKVEFSNTTHTVCQCNHLTNFAVLMDVQAILLPIPHQIALQIITYVGCIISIICLVLAVITFQIFRGLKSDRTTIHCNLCFCLLIAEVLFLLGIEQTENKLACSIIAGALQFFFLSAFAWMFFEGFQLYVMLVEVFEAEKSRLRWYYLFAYGIPFIIVLTSALIYPQGYGTDNFCWLKTENYFIYSFVGPVIVVLCLNVIFLTLAIVKMCIHANNSVSIKNKEHSRLASTSGKEENALSTKFQANLVWLKGAIILVFLLGLTWTFGFLYVNKESVAVAYVFATLNSLQGFFIFLFHCVQNEKVRKEYRKFIRRHSWLPKCLRCSKSGAGASSSSGSSGLAKERRTSLYAGSNGNPSGSHSHSTDSPHGASLQRGWNSRSCSNVNRVAKTPVPTSTSGTMAATLCRPPPSIPSPPLEAPNTSTLPYIRNFYNNSSPVISNLTKSASTWGPLHKPLHWKNISFKSYSRDSGHGGSEQEDSPRSQGVLNDTRLNNAKDVHRQAFLSAEGQQMSSNMSTTSSYADYAHRLETLQHPKHISLAQTLQVHGQRRKNGNFCKPINWNHHTYTEIYDGRMPRCLAPEDDPVYEEIERNEIQVSDMSDEDGKRQSDMSRQSSRSYGDHRPLIPCSPGIDRNIIEATPKHKELNRYTPEMESYRMRPPNYYRGDTARSLAAVLDGETVVCHLEPPDMYPRTVGLPPYSES
ncbi:latrophilin Cirl isoform X1 [Harmonia axyridis]|uniref:latrophilin Cirl isoform X1 n=1 Tax=Harmonia axyridis TaxID=115357 RepID=UPI001E276CFF|nr:latrophilin Cirl isoform X1 [Harmonia axyridis]XP_045481262.1 latrophilin Cirl isoform X1 [Harmonia axyridis]XP_045481263.1 latrophilin Cirl isoform X1 [Harmonia axyridis]XP_045481264.1 latrophilin Cirl isoform X1 [Harmonia axyridis]XP_045481265.1 latrophilin Cirl isoform X1 [Harmonia axyridis]